MPTDRCRINGCMEQFDTETMSMAEQRVEHRYIVHGIPRPYRKPRCERCGYLVMRKPNGRWMHAEAGGKYEPTCGLPPLVKQEVASDD